MAEYRHLGVPHPQWENFPHNLPPHTRICSLTRDRHPITPHPNLEIFEFTIPARDNYPIRIRAYQQSQLDSESLPLLIYFHGGGFVTGGLESDDKALRRVAAELPIVVLSVEYRLAPEYPFPVGVQDGEDVVRWAASKQAQSGNHLIEYNLRADPSSGLILGGTSAGANFIFGISHLITPEANPRNIDLYHAITGILFLSGTIVHEDARPAQYLPKIRSIDEITSSAGLTKEAIAYFAAKYSAPPTDPRRSPLLFPSHANLTRKAVVYVCGWDPRRDETMLFEEILKNEGVVTKRFVYEGLPHGFWTICPDLECSREWEGDFVEGVRFLFEM
ncbi:Alpha/Beta hydrolase protein [Aspergillus stella-maris]|uniref:Alpha/Beta hydrolase protein n=1 Tax=Aspergillus stella-maris TaxID=1810926 RepID=UPI003CCE5379